MHVIVFIIVLALILYFIPFVLMWVESHGKIGHVISWLLISLIYVTVMTPIIFLAHIFTMGVATPWLIGGAIVLYLYLAVYTVLDLRENHVFYFPPKKPK